MMKLSHQQALYVVLFLGAAVAMSAGAWAGPGGHGPQRGPDFEALQSELELSDQQVAELQEIMTETRTSMMALRNAGGAQRQRPSPEMRVQAEQIRAEADDRIAAVLTPDQYQQFEALREARRGHRSQGHGHGHGQEL